MSIYHFKCVSCTKLMGITEDFLGKQMRCPHCQTIQMLPMINAAGSAEAPPAPVQAVEPDTDIMNFKYQSPESPASEELPREILSFPGSDKSQETSAEESPAVLPPVEVKDSNEVPTEIFNSEANGATQSESAAPAPWDNAPSITGEAARKRPIASKSMAMPIIFFSLLSY
ncbi:MAG: hypothetical protein WCN64_15285, partial [Planctomycetota bacterium]